MPSLPNVVVPDCKTRWIESKEKVQNRIQETARMIGGKIVGRFNRDNPQPEDGWNPRFPNLPRRFFQWEVLFRGIVRSLARDHDIVHMAFAKARDADANKPRFLE
jgi:hypothetical protein